jgi:hypothetical protein
MRADFERRSSCFGGSLSTSYWTPSKGSIFRFNEKEGPLAQGANHLDYAPLAR